MLYAYCCYNNIIICSHITLQLYILMLLLLLLLPHYLLSILLRMLLLILSLNLKHQVFYGWVFGKAKTIHTCMVYDGLNFILWKWACNKEHEEEDDAKEVNTVHVHTDCVRWVFWEKKKIICKKLIIVITSTTQQRCRRTKLKIELFLYIQQRAGY